MSTMNEKPEDGNTNAKGQQHEAAPDADTGNALDINALDEISGGGLPQVERPLIRHVVEYDPDKAIGGREGKSGA
jgi:hypothetical protein